VEIVFEGKPFDFVINDLVSDLKNGILVLKAWDYPFLMKHGQKTVIAPAPTNLT
jgi:hypothetical protein